MLGAFDVKLSANIKGLQTGLRKASGMLKGFSSEVKQTGQTLTRNLTVPIIGLGTAMVTTAATFEKSMNQVGAITGATGAEFDALREQAKQLGSTTKFTASEAAEGMSFLAMAGFDTVEIMKAMPGVLDLASAGAMDLATASDIASNILTGFGKDASEINHLVDVMAKTFTSSNTNLMQLGFAMKYVAPVAAGMGVSLEETSAIIGMLSDAGIQASMAGTTLRGIMTTLGEASSELGFRLKDANGNLRPMAEILDELVEKSGGTQQAIEIFGKRAGPGLVALLSQGTDKLREFDEALKNSGGTAKEIADRQMQGLRGALTELRSAIEGMFIAFADVGVLTKLEGIVDSIANKIRQFSNASDETKESVLRLLAILAGLGPALIAIGTALGVIAGAIALLGGPITAIIAGVVALAGVLFYLLDNWNAVIERISDISWWQNTLIGMAQLVFKFNPFSLLLDGFLILVRTLTGAFGDFFNWLISSMLKVKADILVQFAKLALKAEKLLSKIPFFEGAADSVRELGEELVMASADAKIAAESGADFAQDITDSLSNLDEVNPFRAMANNLDDLKTEQGEYNNEFKSLGEYISSATHGLAEMLGLSELLKGTTAETAQETETEDATPRVDPVIAEQTVSILGRIQNFTQQITHNAKVMNDAYKALGDSVADAFTTALMQGTALLDQLKELGKVILGKSFQMLLSFALGGGMSIGGEAIGGFFGTEGGLFGSIGKLLFGKKVGDALITDSGKVVEFHPNDNILAMKDLGGLQTQGGTQNMHLGGEFRIKGTDLVLALSEANYSLGR